MPNLHISYSDTGSMESRQARDFSSPRIQALYLPALLSIFLVGICPYIFPNNRQKEFGVVVDNIMQYIPNKSGIRIKNVKISL